MTPDEQPALGPLATSALRSLREAFAERNHNPGTTHMTALAGIMGTLEAMVEGRAARKVYLSALDPGTGKTQSVVHFARTLAASPAHRNTGMLILVGRITEAEDLAREMGEALRPSLAILTAQTDINAAWSGAEPAEAQILITTQQRAERAVRGSTFNSIAALHYKGRPRGVRVWDETWLPGVTVDLRRDDVLGLLSHLRAPFPGLAAALDSFGKALGDLNHDQTVDVPDFEALTGVSMYGIMDTLGSKFTDQQYDALRDLFAAGGSTVRAWDDARQGVSLVTYSDLWPDDFAPVLVLDASGRVRSTYSTMAEHRDNLVSLPTAVKDYGPLQVMVWASAGGKHAFHQDTKRGHLIEGIADLIRT